MFKVFIRTVLLGSALLASILPALAGTPHTSWGKVAGSGADTNCGWRFYVVSRPTEVLTGKLTSVSGTYVYQALVGNLASPWASGDDSIAIVSKETGAGTTAHAGYYAVMNEDLSSIVNPQPYNDATLRAINAPSASLSGSNVSVSWTALTTDPSETTTRGNNIIGYNVYRSTNGTSFVKLNSVTVTGTNYSDSSVAGGQSYYYAIEPVFRGNIALGVYSANSSSITAPIRPAITSIDWDTTDGSPATPQNENALNKNHVYGTIIINGNNFGADPGDGNRDTTTNHVTIGGVMVNDTVDTGGDDGIQVYSWSNTKIVCGVPKGNGGNYVTAGEIPVAVTAASQGSASVNITIKPKIYAVKPTAGAAGTLVTIEGTAFSATPAGNSVSFHGMTTAASSFIRGTGNDTIEVYVPARATTGALSVTVNSQASNTNYDWGTQEPVTFTINGASINLTYDANRGNVFWIAIPYSTPSVKAADLLAEINTQAGQAAGSGALVTSIGRWKGGANPQVFETYDYLAALDSWSGSNFDLVPGEAVYVNIAQSVSFTLSGGHNPNTTLSFPYDASRGNVFWVSLPYSGDYADAAAVVADINTQSGQAAGSGALVTSIGRWNGTANPQVFETYDYLDALDSWSGSNFKFTPGEGYYLNIAQNINSWRPKTK